MRSAGRPAGRARPCDERRPRRGSAPIAGDLLLDLSRCEFVDSTVTGVVVSKSQELARDGHRLALVVPEDNGIVVRVVDVVGLRTLVTVHHEVPAAEVAPYGMISSGSAAGTA